MVEREDRVRRDERRKMVRVRWRREENTGREGWQWWKKEDEEGGEEGIFCKQLVVLNRNTIYGKIYFSFIDPLCRHFELVNDKSLTWR